MKTETGVMVMKDGKGWGIEYENGHSTCYGWVAPEDALIHDPQYFKRPTDVTYKGSPYTRELASAKLVRVKRTTTIEIVPDEVAA